MHAIALAATSVLINGSLLIALSFAIGVFDITLCVLPSYATLRTAMHRQGGVTALLAQGVIAGMSVARNVSGFIGLHFVWHAVYVIAAVLMVLLLWPLQQVLRSAPADPQTANAGRRTLPLPARPVVLRDRSTMQANVPVGTGSVWSYPALMWNLVEVFRYELTVRRSALCQALN